MHFEKHIRSDISTTKIMSGMKYLMPCFMLACFLLSAIQIKAQDLITIKSGATVALRSGSVVQVNGSLKIDAGGTLSQTGNCTVRLTGDLTNDGTLTSGSGTFYFTGTSGSSINGSGTTSIFNLNINKPNNPDDIVSFNSNMSVTSNFTLTDGTFRFVNNASRSLTINGSLIINPNNTFDVSTTGAQTHNMSIRGSLSNSGNLDLNTGTSTVNTTFTGNVTSVVSGSGAVTKFNEIIINKTNKTNEVQISPQNFDAPQGFLTLTRGTFHFAGNYNINNTFFKSAGATYSIPAQASFWLDNQNATVTGQAAGANLAGDIRLQRGNMNIGVAGAQYNLLYSANSNLTIESGQLNVTGRISRDADNNASIHYSQTGGAVTVGTETGTDATRGIFDIGAAASIMKWTGGTIELRSATTNNTGDYLVLASTDSVSGGLLRINSLAAQSFRINSTCKVNELTILGTNNPAVQVVNNNLSVITNINLAGTGSGRLSANSYNILLGGNWVNNFSDADGFNPGTGTVTFNGANTQQIGGTQTTTFNHLSINKTNGNVELADSVTINGNLRLLSNSLLDIKNHNLTLGQSTEVYSDNGTSTAFSYVKNIHNSLGVNGGIIKKMITPGTTSQFTLKFPLGTTGTPLNVYTPAEITFRANRVTFNNGAFVTLKAIPQEHPRVERNNISLKKYWVVNSSNFVMQNQAVDVLFKYDITEVAGNEGSYMVLYYSPSYPNPNGFWQSEPGVSDDVVDFNAKVFYSLQLDSLNGDWTAGEEDAANVIYYSRLDGDYNTASTWSKVNFGGTASNTAPNKRSDRVRIRNNNISINTPVSQANLVSVETGATLQINGSNYLSGDTTKVLDNAALVIGHPDGITANTDEGAIRTIVRDLSSNVVYKYNGVDTLQSTGDGIPATIRSLVADKSNGDTLKLGRFIEIKDSLVVNSGILDIDAFSVNGNSAGRTIRMRGGELIVRNTFPVNYTAPSFNAGTITFAGTGNTTIPSTASSPAVIQYNNLKCAGQRAGTITFPNAGEIRIAKDFDISTQEFTGSVTQRFYTDGSTVVFNGTSPDTQKIQCKPFAPADTITYLSYYNLKIDGSGLKQLYSPSGNPLFIVLNNITIDTNCTLAANGFNLEVQRNWVNNGGIFAPGTKTVVFRSPVVTVNNDVRSRSVTDNPFYNVLIAGPGNILPSDNISVLGDLAIESGSNFVLANTELNLSGNWINRGGTFTPGTSKVNFVGSSVQLMSKTAGNETFNKIFINNPYGVNASAVGATADNGVIINDTINLTRGNLITRGRQATALSVIARPGATPGHIDGALRKNVDTASVTTVYEVGYSSSYTPVTLAFAGVGGSSGMLQVTSDTVHTTSSPVSTNGSIQPANSGMSDSRQVRRQWTVSVPSASTFSLGPLRTYDATLNYIGNAYPSNDLRNGANPSFFEARLLNGANWIAPNRLDKPRTGTRTGNSITYRLLTNFGTLITGEPENQQYSFYSINSGNWTVASNWSTQDYDGPPSTIAPTNTAFVYIGDGKTITLNANATVNTPGIVTIDSSGKLDATSSILDGTGTFLINKDGALGIGDINGIRQATSFGNIQTTTRYFNGNPVAHNRSHFVYTGGAGQTQANEALPQTMASLMIDKTGNSVTMNRQSIVISDSFYIKSGTYIAGQDITLNGNMRRDALATFNPGTRTVTISGSKGDTITNLDANPIPFNNLTINKAVSTGTVYLSQNSPVTVNGTLLFSAANRAVIDARTNSGCYVSALGTVTRTGLGHVNGEMRKNIPINATTVTFEVGDTTFYSPYRITTANNGGTAGVVGMTVMMDKHLNLDNAFNPPISPVKYITRYWRLTRPPGSSFVRGNRTLQVNLTFIDPNDVSLIDGAGCVEIGIWKGASELWETMHPNTTNANYVAGYGCGDTRLTLGTYAYSGSATTVQVNTIPTGVALGSTETLADGSLLLGDFVAGNQNSIPITSYWSRTNGNWTDPNTWSTTSYNGPAAASYPQTQYDIVNIGNGRRVVLNENIGTNRLYGDPRNAYYGPNTIVEESGNLSFNVHVLRGNSIIVKKGATIELGSANGLYSNLNPADRGLGNIMTASRTYEDSINIVFTAEGYTPNNTAQSGYSNFCTYCRPASWNAATLYITNVTLAGLNHTTGTPGGQPAVTYYPERSATLTAGQNYTLSMSMNNLAGAKHWQAYIDYDRNGTFDDNATERLVNADFNNTNTQTVNFTVPANVQPGSTQMRVMLKSGNGGITSCTGTQTGEIEDYTIVLVNDTTQVVQVTGTAMPTNLASIKVHGKRNSNNSSYLNLGNNITVRDSVKITSGVLNAQTFSIKLAGDFINDTLNGFSPGTGTVEFYRNISKDTIRGNAAITFNNLRTSKLDSIVFQATNVTVTGAMTLDSNRLYVIGDSDTLTLDQNATLASGTGGFSKTRMLQVSGSANSGTVIKRFTTAAGAKSFVFPVGVDTVYNAADISITGTYPAIPSIALQLHSGLHPGRLSNNILKKYWNLAFNNINSPSASLFRFTYHSIDTNGNTARYIPALFKTDNNWEINVGTSPQATTSPITITNSYDINGDWTAGEADGFFSGRIFYSRNTGTWNTPSNWSNIGHAGLQSSYYPGQLFRKDTVIIDGHTITYNIDSVVIDTARIGGAFAGTGTLQFGPAPLVKWMLVTNNFHVDTDGVLNGTAPGGRKDTLILKRNITNNSTTGNITLSNNAANYTVLKFTGSGNSRITGEGVWGSLADVILDKSGQLADTLVNTSVSYSNWTTSSTNYLYTPLKGVLKQTVNASLSISNGSTVNMQPYTGFEVNSGSIISNGSIVSNINTTFLLNGGNFQVGDAQNENFLYNTGTNINLLNGKLDIAGCLTQYQAGSAIDFTITPTGEVRVLRFGNTDVTRIGFDISSSASSFNMNGGRVIIAGGTPGANSDYKVNATLGTGMTGGTIQSGDSLLTASGADIKLAGNMPVANLHCVGGGVFSLVKEGEFTIRNDCYIDDDHTVQLSGNRLNLGGNLTNYGVFDAITGSGLTDPKLLVMNGGSSVQTIFNEDAGGIEFYNWRIDKTDGNILLGTGANSNIQVRGTLEFATGNNAYIDAKTNDQHIELSPSGGSNPQILRNGLGHIYGRLYQNIGTGARISVFPLGADTITSFRPLTFETIGNGGTEGLVGAEAFKTDHPAIATANVKLANNVQKYWNVEQGTGFDLGARTYKVTTQFMNPGDKRNNPNMLFFEHYMYSPAWNDPAGAWYALTTIQKTDSTLTSSGNTRFGDIIVAEPEGLTYFSITSGTWNDPATWSTAGYEGAPETDRYPSQTTDIARIGNGKRVTVPEIITPSVRSVFVEKYNNLPGELYIQGNLNYIRGVSFVLNDSCTIALQHLNGISPSGNSGAVQMDSRTFGVSRYVFNSTYGSQNAGRGVPDSVQMLIIDNPSSPTNNVWINSIAGSTIRIQDSISIIRGTLNSPNRFMALYGDMSLDNNGLYKTTDANFYMSGTRNHTLSFGNDSGVTFYNLYMDGGNLLVSKTAQADPQYSNLYIENELRLNSSGVINVRQYDSKVIIKDTALVLRTGTGYVDGALRKPVGAGAGTYYYEIGNGPVYTPATLTLTGGTGGQAGSVEAINIAPLPNDPLNNPFVGHRMDPVVSIHRYWKLDSAGTFRIGNRQVNLKMEVPLSETTVFDLNKTVARHRSNIITDLPLWTERKAHPGFDELVWTTTATTAALEIRAGADLWSTLGEFYIGEKATRIFYSRNGGGDWDNNNSWAFDKAGTILAPAGEYPNPDWDEDQENEVRDSVVIDGNDVITLNIYPQIAYLNIEESGTLAIADGFFMRQSSRGISNFALTQNGTIENRSSMGIETDTSQSIFRFDNLSFAPTGNFLFTGDMQQKFGSGFPAVVNNVTIANTGTGNGSYVSLPANDLSINGSLNILSGELRPLNATTNVRLAGNLTVNGIYDGSKDVYEAPANSKFTFQGSGDADQTVTGTGSLAFYDLVMNRGAGNGAASFDMTASVAGTLDLREAANDNNQIISLGINGNINVLNTNTNSIVDYSGSGTLRYVRTSPSSGLLSRSVTTGQNYLYPVGSYEEGSDHYTPMTFTAGGSGNNGLLGVRTSPGTSADYPGGHLFLPSARTTDYIQRYWSVGNVTTTIPGKLRFDYVADDISGDENNIERIGRWCPARETAGGAWQMIPGTLTIASDYFETLDNFDPAGYAGDWTIANSQAFRRIFYSLRSGDWSSDQSWTFSPTHSGPIFGAGLFPNDPEDSVVIGGGSNGVNNHEITLDVTPVVNIGGVALGTGTTNTGTLNTLDNSINGDYFTIGDFSTLKIGSPDGITASTSVGNIRTMNRTFSAPGIFPIFEYNGKVSQVIGDGLPGLVRSLVINNSGNPGDNTVTMTKSILINDDLQILLGRLDAQSFTTINPSGDGTLAIGPAATLSIGGNNDLAVTAPGYSAYTIDAASIIDFYGSDQVISNLPAGLIPGLGNVIVRNAGTKSVTQSLLIRGNLTITNNASLHTSSGVDALQVNGSVINSSAVTNEGVIEIGVCN